MPEVATPKKSAGWTTVAFGDVVQLSKERSSDPEADGYERYIGLEHIDPGELRVRRWGDIADGVTFTNVFEPGQVLFGKRRAYQRKVAVADFSGVCSGDIYVLEPKGDALLPELLPFICQTEAFFEHAVGTSAGSLSPRTNWKSLAAFEFALPPIEEQRRMLQVLQATGEAEERLWQANKRAATLRLSLLEELVDHSAGWDSLPIGEVCDSDSPLCYGVVQPGDNDPEGVPLLRVCDIETSAVCLDDLKRVSREIDESYRRSRVQRGDVLVSVVGTIGRVYVVSAAESGFNIARAIARIRTSKCDSAFLAAYLRSPKVQRTLTGEAFETARKTLNLDALARVEVPVPPPAIQEEWRERLEETNRVVASLGVRLDVVRLIRKQLVAEAFTGEVG